MRLEDKEFFLVPIFFVLFLLFLPMSPSLKSIFFGCGLAAVLLSPYYNQYLYDAYNTMWGRMALVFFAFILLACLWSEAPYAMQLSMIGKYSKLIYLPILAVAFINPKTRQWGLNSYLLAMFITCILSILKSRHFLAGYDPGEVFYNHIVTGYMMVLASYLSGVLAFRSSGWLRIAYILLLLLTSYQVFFINTGRTGYVIYFILMVLLLGQSLSLKHMLFGALLMSGLIPLVYYSSATLHTRVTESINEVRSFQHDDSNNSIGYRVQFHHYAQSLFEKHPLIGIGTGGFKYNSFQDKPFMRWGNELKDPHSQYWMILAEQGVLGILLLFLFLGTLFITSFQLTETQPILLGTLISFGFFSISDTVFCYSTAGYLLIAFSALCFGELIEKHALSIIKNNGV